jgi:hypothetical protein
MCSIVVQGDVDRASLAVTSPSINSSVKGGAEHPVRRSLILCKVFVVEPMLPLTLFVPRIALACNGNQRVRS